MFDHRNYECIGSRTLTRQETPGFLASYGIRADQDLIDGLIMPYKIGVPTELSSQVELNHIELGPFSYINRRTQMWNVKVGSYVSIAHDCRMGLVNHPHDWFSCTPMGYQNFFPERMPGYVPQGHFVSFPQPVTIEDGAWIGANVIVSSPRPLTIGRGAIVAAGAVVTKDVLPYEIVGGNPARHIRFRLPSEVQALIDQTQWSRFDLHKIHAAGITVDLSDIDKTIKTFEDHIKPSAEQFLIRYDHFYVAKSEEQLHVTYFKETSPFESAQTMS